MPRQGSGRATGQLTAKRTRPSRRTVARAPTATACNRHCDGHSGADQHSAADPHEPLPNAEQDAHEVHDPEPDLKHDGLGQPVVVRDCNGYAVQLLLADRHVVDHAVGCGS